MIRLRFPAGADMFPFCSRFDAGAGAYLGTYPIVAGGSFLAVRRLGSDAHRPLLLTPSPGNQIHMSSWHGGARGGAGTVLQAGRSRVRLSRWCHWNFLLT